MNFAVICKGSQIIKILKFFIFISLAAIFYIFYFTDVLNKFAERDTTLIYTQETIEENERDSPFITFCIPEVSWFGHYIREWKDFPVLLEAWKQFFGIEVTFL